jgi:hypothetical protein
MWVFTKHGFFSAVCARQGNGTWWEEQRGSDVHPEP